jgi:hypothetical protein
MVTIRVASPNKRVAKLLDRAAEDCGRRFGLQLRDGCTYVPSRAGYAELWQSLTKDIDLKRLQLMWWKMTEEERDARCGTCRLPLEICAGQAKEDDGLKDPSAVSEFVASSAIATTLRHHTYIYRAALLRRSSINSVLHFPSPLYVTHRARLQGGYTGHRVPCCSS